MTAWDSQKSAELYNVQKWSQDYFQINESGHVELALPGKKSRIDLKKLVDDLEERGLRSPILIRFPDIVSERIETLYSAFDDAIKNYDYQAEYRGVYPIKVNQQRYLVEDILKSGAEKGLGLEAGSKPELLICLSLLNQSRGLIICNGFKDRDYVETALLAQKLGKECIIVVDRYSEIELIMACSRELGIVPKIGFRAKLESRSSGKWAESSGVRSKFGLSTAELVEGLDLLKREGFTESLVLLHFHIGSQISDLRSLKESLIESSVIYTELYQLGATSLSMIDVGGGLGVDYDGSKSNWDHSRNYSVKEYASDVVWQIQQVCQQKKVPVPTIVSESGRYLVAHHSVLVSNVVGVNQMALTQLPVVEKNKDNKDNKEHKLLRQMRELCDCLQSKHIVEQIHDALKFRDDALTLFKHGYINLKERAAMETMFRVFAQRAMGVLGEASRGSEEKEKLRKFLIDTYFCNFSVFQSAPDNWAVGQLFPVMPLHRLNEEPTKRGILFDLTCDSDGKIDHFISSEDDPSDSMPLHELKQDEDYFVGIFLVGAYQEILGDLHNLFGDTDAVHVSVQENSYKIEHIVEGDTILDVLSYIEFDKPVLVNGMRKGIESALEKKSISLKESRLLMKHFEEALGSYTYLEERDFEEESRFSTQVLRSLASKKK